MTMKHTGHAVPWRFRILDFYWMSSDFMRSDWFN